MCIIFIYRLSENNSLTIVKQAWNKNKCEIWDVRVRWLDSRRGRFDPEQFLGQIPQ